MSRALLEMPPMLVSVIGAPASGKSYFLASMTWGLRSHLPKLGWTFSDANPTANARLLAQEQRLFLSADQTEFVAIEKTATEGADLYRSILIDGQSMVLPRPFQFSLVPRSAQRDLRRVLLLYDNAGEHFLPGAATASTPTTEHLARAEIMMFLVDPTQDPRLRPLCRTDDPQLTQGPRGARFSSDFVRHETILHEVALRVRSARGLSHEQRHDVPLMVIIAKADLLRGVLGDVLDTEPLVAAADSPLALDVQRVAEVSKRCRAALWSVAPELVSAAEAFSKRTFFVPISALGHSPSLVGDEAHRMLGVRPQHVRPQWVTIPMLVAMQSLDPHRFPTTRRSRTAAATDSRPPENAP
jgi:hypothetical protein